jgi:hypothetical protein
VHGAYEIQLTYPGNILVHVSNRFPNGICFIGDDGWIFVARGAEKAAAGWPHRNLKALDASDPKLITGTAKVELYRSTNHHANWLECVKSRKEPIAPVNNGHYVFAACAVGWIAMKLARPVTWDVKAETFLGDDEANKMLRRPERAGYGIFNLLAKQ